LISEREEHDCLHALISGTDAWPRFWDLFGDYVFYELRALAINDEYLREDIYHELVLKLIDRDFEVMRSFLERPRQYSFTALLRVMARNKAISHLRRQRRIVLVDDHQHFAAASDGDGWGGDPAANHEARQLLVAILHDACPGQENSEGFRIMYLRFVEQQSVNVIAAELRMKPNTVSQRIRYYLNRLRQRYGLRITEHVSG